MTFVRGGKFPPVAKIVAKTVAILRTNMSIHLKPLPSSVFAVIKCRMEVDVMQGLFRRGKKGLFTARLQVPTQFQMLAGKSEVWQATGTTDYGEALDFRSKWRRQKLAEWNSELAEADPPNQKSRYQLAAEIAISRGEEYRTADSIADLRIEDLLGRVEGLKAAGDAPTSVAAQAILGGIEMPRMTLMEVARSMPERFPEDYNGKTEKGKKGWASRWTRPSAKFVEVIGADPDFINIERKQGVVFRDALKDLVLDDDGLKAETAIKELQNLNGLWNRHFEALGVDSEEVPPSPWRNLSKPLYKLAEGDGQKFEIPVDYLQKIIAPGALDSMNEEARDLIYVLIETGARQSEITDLPPSSIFLDAKIPHIKIQREKGEFARNIKNSSSEREIPLVGVALEAMRRHPEGFPRYRGKGTFSAAANAFLHDNGLLPEMITIGGTRHSFEKRMKRVCIDSDDRGAMMGHSIKRIRGREVYGDPLDLQEKLEIHHKIILPQNLALPTPLTALPQHAT